MSDVLAFTVPTFDPDIPTRRYPSVNGMWAQGTRYGKKTLEYHYLFDAVREAARAEMERTGWTTATSRVEVHIRRYVPTMRPSDAGNIGKCELDAMEPAKPDERPFPGVYANDNLVRPFPDVVPDLTPGAIDRIAIAVFRIPAPTVTPPRKPRVTRLPQQTAQFAVVAPNVAIRVDKPVAYKPGDPIPDGHVLLDGQPVKMSREEMLERAFGGSREPAPRARQRSR